MSNNIFLLGQSGKLQKFGSEKLPIQKEKNNSDWVIFGEKDGYENQQPQYYEDLYRLSSKNNAILKTKNRYVYGKGFAVDRSPRYKVHNPSKEARLIGFIDEIEQSRVFQRLTSDRNIYGGFACEMIPSKDGLSVVPHYLPFKNIRVSKDQYSKDGELLPTVYYYTSDWSKRQKAKQNADFQEFQQWTWGEEKVVDGEKYIVYFKDEGFEDQAYPLPDYVGGIPYIDADTEVGNFVYNNVRGGFSAGVFVEFYDGEPSVQQKAEIEKMWHSNMHGSQNAGKAVLNFADQAGDSTKITPLGDNGQDDRYINLNNQIREEVFTAHTTSPMVVGMSGENGFSNNADEKRVAIEAFKSDFVDSAQQPFNDFMNEILSFNEISGRVYLDDLDPIMVQFSESALLQMYKPKQLAKLAGLPEPEETDIESEMKQINIMFDSQIDNIIASQFESCGIEDTEFEVIDSMELFATDSKDAEFKSIKFRLDKFATTLENSILKFLNADPAITNKTLSTLLDKTEAEIEKALADMVEDGLIDEDRQVQEQPEDEIFTVYKYEKRSDASGPAVKDTTRDFCRRLVSQSSFKSWTIEDINRMNNGMGLDVFTSRGGWKTIEGTNRHQPFCRHIWKSFLVRRR